MERPWRVGCRSCYVGLSEGSGFHPEGRRGAGQTGVFQCLVWLQFRKWTMGSGAGSEKIRAARCS